MEAADHLIATANLVPISGAKRPGALWEIPASQMSELAGTYYGYAHGAAGITTFLSAVFAATQEERFLKAGLAGFRTIRSATTRHHSGRVSWPHGPDDSDDHEHWPFWCNGSAGIGGAALRLYAVSGYKWLLDLSRAAAVTSTASPWNQPIVHCHGIVGGAELALDCALRGTESALAKRVTRAADVINARRQRCLCCDQKVWPSDAGGPTCGLMTGLSGIGSFALRLRTSSGQPLMLDDLFFPTNPALALHEPTSEEKGILI